MGLTTCYTIATLWGLAYHGQLPGGGAAEKLGIKADELAAGLLILSLFPSALYVTWVTGGRQAVRALFGRMLRWRGPGGWWVTALLALPLLTIGLAVLLGDQLKDPNLTSFVVSQLAFLVLNFLIVNLWEEGVWAGVVQTRLEQRRGLFISSVLTAIPFAAVHVPLEFFADSVPSALDLLIAFVVYFVIGVIVRPMFAVLRRATLDNMFLVALTHTVFNRTNNNDGLAANVVDGDMRGLTGLIAVVLVTVTVAVLYRSRMTQEFARQLDLSGPGLALDPRPH